MPFVIIVNEDSAAGAIKHARIADRVVALGLHVIESPSAQSSRVFANRELQVALADADRIAIWFDTSPRHQAALLGLLDHLAKNDAGWSEKIDIVRFDGRLGEARPEEVKLAQVSMEPITLGELRTASHFWDAWRQSTPVQLAELGGAGCPDFPLAGQCALGLLAELPAEDTALGFTEMLILEMIGEGNQTGESVAIRYLQQSGPGTYDGLEFLQILEHLCQCPSPAVAGLSPQEPGEGLSEWPGAQRYRSTLSLTEFGRSLVGRRADFSEHNPIRRWWGNTLLSNDQLWRWDAAYSRLRLTG